MSGWGWRDQDGHVGSGRAGLARSGLSFWFVMIRFVIVISERLRFVVVLPAAFAAAGWAVRSSVLLAH